jgi:hypothetical protein
MPPQDNDRTRSYGGICRMASQCDGSAQMMSAGSGSSSCASAIRAKPCGVSLDGLRALFRMDHPEASAGTETFADSSSSTFTSDS